MEISCTFSLRILFFLPLWRERLPIEIPARLRYRDQNNNWLTIRELTFWWITWLGFAWALWGLLARFMPIFYWLFLYLQNICTTTVAKVPFLAWAKKVVKQVSQDTRLVLGSRKGSLASVVTEEFRRHENARWNVGITRAITQFLAKTNSSAIFPHFFDILYSSTILP